MYCARAACLFLLTSSLSGAAILAGLRRRWALWLDTTFSGRPPLGLVDSLTSWLFLTAFRCPIADLPLRGVSYPSGQS